MSTPIRILHLSNFCFRADDKQNRALDGLLEATRGFVEDGKTPDLITVTGDIANSGRVAEYDTAKIFFRKLLTNLKLPGERLLLVPGNHDITRNGSEDLVRELQNLLAHDDQKLMNQIQTSPGRDIFLNRFVNYQRFARDISDQPHTDPFWHRTINIKCVKLGVTGLCSSWASLPDQDDV